MDTYSALQDSEKQLFAILKSAFDVTNLTASAFLDSSGKSVKLTSEALKDRPDGITYFRFNCNIDPAFHDIRVDQDPLCFQFSLRLPQQHYDKTTRVVQDISSPTVQLKKPEAKSTGVAAILDNANIEPTLFATPTKPIHDDLDDINNTLGTADTPKMSVLFKKQNNNVMIGYFGKLSFLDNQTDFAVTFGSKPTLLPPNPTSREHTVTAKTLYAYGEKCKLDVFLAMCRKYYVGHDSVDNSLSTQDVCRQISSLKQDYKDNHGRLLHDTPDNLFNKFLQLSSNLPESSRLWPLQLCSAYFAALSSDLTTRMVTEHFVMPSLIDLDTKSKQLMALQHVRESASREFKALQDEEDRVNLQIRAVLKSSSRGFLGFTPGVHFDDSPTEYNLPPNPPLPPLPSPSNISGSTYFQQSSQAEQTITKYKGHHATDIQTRTDPKTNIKYPYDPEYDFTSRFAVGFKGCYICGSVEHFSSNECPQGISNSTERKLFFNEMWAHKPHTKRKQRQPNKNGSQHQATQYGNVHNLNIHRPPQGQNPYGPSVPIRNRSVDNAPAWKRHRNSDPKTDTPPTAPLFVISAGIFECVATEQIRPMPLALDNGLPSIQLRFGNENDKEVSFSTHVDSCAAMNVGNLRLHHWIITTNPNIVESYIQFDDENPFDPIALNCAVDKNPSTHTDMGNKLTAMVTYKTRYFDDKHNPVTLSFGLGANVAVNAIIGKPTLHQWRCVLDFDSNSLISRDLNTKFPLNYNSANSGIPAHVKFNNDDFIRPPRSPPDGRVLIVSSDRDQLDPATTPTLTPSQTASPIIINAKSDTGCLVQTISNKLGP